MKGSFKVRMLSFNYSSFVHLIDRKFRLTGFQKEDPIDSLHE